jgi:hypothetical protein
MQARRALLTPLGGAAPRIIHPVILYPPYPPREYEDRFDGIQTTDVSDCVATWMKPKTKLAGMLWEAVEPLATSIAPVLLEPLPRDDGWRSLEPADVSAIFRPPPSPDGVFRGIEAA